jgi:EmrB/QacA subfamily drug resistance transporter
VTRFLSLMVEDQPHNAQAGSVAYKWKVLSTVAMSMLMATMDASITNISFPVLTEVFNTELTTVMWVTVAYVLVSTCSMLLLGKISDIVGRKKIYNLGMFIFTLGLITCSLAQGMGQLVFFRCLQGLGAAMTISCGTALVTEAFSAREIGRGLGLLGISVSLGFIIGPVLGGFLLHYLDWRAIFYVRVPVALLSLFMGLILLKKEETIMRKIRLDLTGTLTSSAGLFCLVFGVSQVKNYGLASPFVYGLAGVGILLLIAFAFAELHAGDPLIDLSLFKNRVFRNAILGLFLTFFSAPPFILIMPFYLMQGIGLTPSEAGLILAVNSMATIVSGPISGSLSDRFGQSRFATAGALITTAAYSCMLGFNLQTTMTAIVPILIFLGIGIGMFQPPNNSMIMGAVPRDRLGTASALIATLRQVGITLGMATVATLYSARSTAYQQELGRQGLESNLAASMSIPPAFHDVLVISIVMGLAVVFLSFLTARKRERTEEISRDENPESTP